MRRNLSCLAALALLAGAQSAPATVIYDATGATDGYMVSTDPNVPTLDDLTVAQGGVLSSVSVALAPMNDPGPDPVTYNIAFYLYLDVDPLDGVPQPNDPSIGLFGVDTRLYRGFQYDQTIAADAGPTLVTFDGLEGQNIVIPDGARLWGGVALFNLSDDGFPYVHSYVGHVAYGPPTVGSSDSDVYNYIGFISTYMPVSLGSGDPGDNTEALGIRLSVVPEPASLGLLAIGMMLMRRRRS